MVKETTCGSDDGIAAPIAYNKDKSEKPHIIKGFRIVFVLFPSKPVSKSRGYQDGKQLRIGMVQNEALKSGRKLRKREEAWRKKEQERNAKLEEKLKEKCAENEALQKEILRLKGCLNADGTNSSLPTSKTPLHKKKVIPNSREKSEKKIGGQTGHPKSKLKAFGDHEVREEQYHKPDACPFCGGTAVETDQNIQKDELDYEVIIRKRRHQFVLCKCESCGQEFHEPILVNLKEDNQYGSHVKALALSLMNVGNGSVNKTRKMIYGLSEEEIHPTDGFLIKQQKKAAKGLQAFLEELKIKCPQLEALYWDDTVIDINKRRSCLRFYGDEQYAFYVAYEKKNKIGLDEDGILKLLPKETIVMHDHNTVNYNKEYSYRNIECNVHLLRDLKKTTDDAQYEWSTKFHTLLTKTNAERNEAIGKGESAFDDAYVKEFFDQFDQIMLEAMRQNQTDFSSYHGKDEAKLIRRILKYKDNYLAWVVNFDLPFSNNLSERALRGVKSKMKVAGQFQSVEAARHYAAIKSYIETCYRNGINEVDALVRLCDGAPYTLKEIISKNSDVS